VRSTVPPSGRAPEPGEDWGLRRIVRRAYPNPSALARDPDYAADLTVYLADMLRPYGLALDPAAMDSRGQSYEEMARVLVELILPEGEQVDLLVVAYAIPDIVPARSICVRLSHLCPGIPMAFGIYDQGTAAPFTALRLIKQYAGTGEARRALLIVLEQSWLPYRPAVPAPVPTGHSGVALLFGDRVAEPPTRLGRLSRIATTAPGDCAVLPAAVSALTDASGDPAPYATTVILGPLLAARAPGSCGLPDARPGPAGRPYTGLWWELAGELSRPRARPRQFVAADYDPGSLTLSLAAFAAAASALPSSRDHARETV
jgi:hypothetical protein